MRALGYKQDPHDPNDLPSEQLLGARTGVPEIVPWSMAEWRVGELVQGRANACVLHALSRAIDMHLRYMDNERGVVRPEIPKLSRRFGYYNALWREAIEAAAAGMQPRPIADEGCYPRLAMRAVQKLGFCDEAVLPYTDTRVILERPPPRAYQAAFDQAGFRYYRVPVIGAARVAENARSLSFGAPPIFGMIVDSAFMRNRGELITEIDMEDPERGGHMLAVLEVTPTEVVFDNWWDKDWGNGGLGRMSHQLFGSSVVTDNYLIQAASMFSGVNP